MLSIAQVSGVIAAAVIIVQYLLPATLAVVLIAHIGVENTAATWSNVNRTISNTIWPQLLRSDSVGNRNRSYVALAVSWTVTMGAILVAVAGAATPLGLRTEIVAGPAGPVYFQYTRDQTAWGRATMDRPDANFGRVCESGRRLNCPGQYQGVDLVETSQGTLEMVRQDNSSIINSTIPANFTDMFSSATSDPGNTLSGLFDIQYRRWTTSRVLIHDGGNPQVRSEETYVENLIPQNAIVVREGLIIDMRQEPGIGFRNHTAPVGLAYGGRWTEDLTWLEPVTSCVDTNLTIEIQVVDSDQEFGSESSVYLIDRGAFRNLDVGALQTPVWTDNQTLDLPGRAYKAARMYNVFVADSLGLSLPLDLGNDTMPRKQIKVDILNSSNTQMDTTLFSWDNPGLIQIHDIKSITKKSLSSDLQTIEPPEGFEPFFQNGRKKLFASNHTAIDQICRGYYVLDETSTDQRASNITNPAVACGLVVGSGHPTNFEEDVPDAPAQDSVEVKQKNIYMCASGVRASVKTIDFKYNGTSNHLRHLEVLGIGDKVYQDEQSKPLWAVESSVPERMTFNPLWGIISDSHESTEGFSTMRADKFWLPPVVSLTIFNTGVDSLAAITAPALTLQRVYAGLLGNDLYTFSSNYLYPLVERFAQLSSNQSSASQIPSLIITDILASLLVGTKTAIRDDVFSYPARLSVNDDPNGKLSRAHVVSYRQVLSYDLRYAVPGLIALTLMTVALIWAILAVLLSRCRILDTMSDMYNQTSTGRLAVGLLRPGQSDPNEPSKTWVDGDGSLNLKFGRIGSRATDKFVTISGGD